MNITDPTKAVCAVLGLVIGLLVALEFRLKGPSLDCRLVASVIGILVGAVIGLALVDALTLVTGQEPAPLAPGTKKE